MRLTPMYAFFVSTLLLWVATASAAAHESDVSCPPSIKVAQTAAELPAAWDSIDRSNDQSHDLRRVSFYRGHPRDLGQLKPSRIDTLERPAGGVSKPVVHTYDFTSRRDEAIFLQCSYELTSVAVFKRVSPVPSSCVVTYTGVLPPSPVLTMKCT